jgi:hypothetical protein
LQCTAVLQERAGAPFVSNGTVAIAS